jgi:hypothetical protein
MSIETVEVTKINEEITLLDWGSTDGQFGRLTIEYNGKGGYTFDAEYLGLSTILEVISVAKHLGELETIK